MIANRVIIFFFSKTQLGKDFPKCGGDITSHGKMGEYHVFSEKSGGLVVWDKQWVHSKNEEIELQSDKKPHLWTWTNEQLAIWLWNFSQLCISHVLHLYITLLSSPQKSVCRSSYAGNLTSLVVASRSYLLLISVITLPS